MRGIRRSFRAWRGSRTPSIATARNSSASSPMAAILRSRSRRTSCGRRHRCRSHRAIIRPRRRLRRRRRQRRTGDTPELSRCLLCRFRRRPGRQQRRSSAPRLGLSADFQAIHPATAVNIRPWSILALVISPGAMLARCRIRHDGLNVLPIAAFAVRRLSGPRCVKRGGQYRADHPDDGVIIGEYATTSVRHLISPFRGSIGFVG